MSSNSPDDRSEVFGTGKLLPHGLRNNEVAQDVPGSLIGFMGIVGTFAGSDLAVTDKFAAGGFIHHLDDNDPPFARGAETCFKRMHQAHAQLAQFNLVNEHWKPPGQRRIHSTPAYSQMRPHGNDPPGSSGTPPPLAAADFLRIEYPFSSTSEYPDESSIGAHFLQSARAFDPATIRRRCDRLAGRP